MLGARLVGLRLQRPQRRRLIVLDVLGRVSGGARLAGWVAVAGAAGGAEACGDERGNAENAERSEYASPIDDCAFLLLVPRQEHW